MTLSSTISIFRAKWTGAFTLAMLVGFGAQAAVLEPIRGGVRVSSDGAYRAVSEPTQLRVGDSVIVNPGGSARVVFENGCVDEIEPGIVYTVPEASACQALGLLETRTHDYTVLAAGAAAVGGIIAFAASGGDSDGGGVVGGIPGSP